MTAFVFSKKLFETLDVYVLYVKLLIQSAVAMMHCVDYHPISPCFISCFIQLFYACHSATSVCMCNVMHACRYACMLIYEYLLHISVYLLLCDAYILH